MTWTNGFKHLIYFILALLWYLQYLLLCLSLAVSQQATLWPSDLMHWRQEFQSHCPLDVYICSQIHNALIFPNIRLPVSVCLPPLLLVFWHFFHIHRSPRINTRLILPHDGPDTFSCSLWPIILSVAVSAAVVEQILFLHCYESIP